ncbi:lipopolysaccharide biosynthesis protein [Carnimonas bestiolae]|uniref:lipopolysaccharide biosynthesis protein n=1 Tax=Carnimonas bestiolae TaxID=3402172 RepID=UPI003EDB7836
MNVAFLRKSLLTFATRGLSAAGTFGLTFTLGVLLGVYQTGLFMTGISCLMGMKVFGCFGMENAVLRFGGIHVGERDQDNVNTHFFCSILVSLLISVPLAIVVFWGTCWISDVLFHNQDLITVFHWVAIEFPLLVVSLLICAWMRAFNLSEVSSFFEIGMLSLFTSLTIWCSHFLGVPLSAGFCMHALVIMTSIMILVGLGIIGWRGVRIPTSFTTISPFMKSLWTYFQIDFVFYLTQWGGLVALGYFVNSSAVGIFSIAHRLAFTVNFILTVFDSIVAPRFAHMSSISDHAGIKRLALDTTKYMTFFSTPIVALLVFAPSWVLAFFGDGFEAGKYSLILLALAQFVNVLTGPAVFMLTMSGYHALMKNILLIASVIGVLCYVVLVPALGSLGAALAIFIIMAFQNIVAAWAVNNKMNINLLGWWKKSPAQHG